jgi:hypothetical protein
MICRHNLVKAYRFIASSDIILNSYGHFAHKQAVMLHLAFQPQPKDNL